MLVCANGDQLITATRREHGTYRHMCACMWVSLRMCVCQCVCTSHTCSILGRYATTFVCVYVSVVCVCVCVFVCTCSHTCSILGRYATTSSLLRKLMTGTNEDMSPV